MSEESNPVIDLALSLGTRASRADKLLRANGLAYFGHAAVYPCLCMASLHPDDATLRESGYVLGIICDQGHLSWCIDAVNYGTEGARIATAYAMGFVLSSQARLVSFSVLRVLTSDSDADVRDTAYSALGRLGGEKSIDLLQTALLKEKNSFLIDVIAENLLQASLSLCAS
jgi:HEAT repeats